MNHLSLDQCQKLKELGFPQNTYFYWTPNVVYEVPPEASSTYSISAGPETEYDVACPTLEELLEWLGDDFLGIGKYDGGKRQPYAAMSEEGRHHCPGADPLEAVYNLCLAVKEYQEVKSWREDK